MKRRSRPKTQAQIDKAAETHRQKKYGVGLDYYNSQLAKQGGGCGVCGAPPGTRRLHIDHDHSWTKVKVVAEKLCGDLENGTTWYASCTYLKNLYAGMGAAKSKAIREVKKQLKQDSVRGLLCYTHNAGLQKFQDNPKLLRAAAKYLEAHQGVS